MKPNEEQLSDVLSEFARTMVTEFPIQRILDRLTERIVDILPVTAAGVTLISPGSDPRYIAASNDAALRYERLQTELGEGPCLLAYQSGQPVSVPNLSEETRFPTFVPRALQEGLAAVFTFPLRHGSQQLGALDLYRDTPGALSDRAMTSAQTLADVAAAYLLNAQAREDLQESSALSRHAALHDALTGVPNRMLLLERIEHALSRSRRTKKLTAVIFIDLDGFKAVNDRYGHATGDAVLISAARRLTGLLRAHDTLARLSGDEFVVLCEDLDVPADASHIAARLEAGLIHAFAVEHVQIELTTSMGIALAGHDSRSPEELLHDADMAMYRAKRGGGASRAVSEGDGEASRQAGLQHELRSALGQGELHLEYQPIVAAADSRMVGAEALLRWQHPHHGTVAPTTFIPLAERAGLITELGEWVLQVAWAEHARQRKQLGGNSRLSMAVNVSSEQLLSAGFSQTVSDVLSGDSSDPSLLTLEITESVLIRDHQRALLVLNDLKEIGVKIALDDFGTGYSSLTHLQRFPVDVVKIDRSFIAHMSQNLASRSIVAAIIDLTHDLGMTVVAEGVETVEQHHEVTALGCDFCQGFYFARPMTAEQLDDMAGRRSSPAAICLPVQLQASTTVADPAPV